jgi:tetratricopeptide (TPR) repeat protein
MANRREAIAAWQQLATRFPDSNQATAAWLNQGDLQRQRGAPDAAIAAYREVLKVREWRGVPWAEANYKIGLAHYEAGDYTAAFGFCQRVYVLYRGVAEWAAQAYLTSGLALEKLNRPMDAIATYRELLADTRLADEPATAEAAERLRQLGGAS